MARVKTVRMKEIDSILLKGRTRCLSIVLSDLPAAGNFLLAHVPSVLILTLSYTLGDRNE